MNKDIKTKNDKKYNTLIIALSIAIPVVVAVLFRVRLDVKLPVFLPPIYATINAITALVLVLAFIAIRSKKIMLHKRLMTFAIILSAAFLVMYVAYHMTSDTTLYKGETALKYVYYFILITHIILSIAVIPFVLITYVRALSGNFEKHRKIAKVTFPLWLYVAVTGVLVYILISPYYPTSF